MNIFNPLKAAYNTLGNTAIKMQVQYPRAHEYLHNIASVGSSAAQQGNPLAAMTMAALSPAIAGTARRIAPQYADRLTSAYSAATKLANSIQLRTLEERSKNAIKPN